MNKQLARLNDWLKSRYPAPLDYQRARALLAIGVVVVFFTIVFYIAELWFNAERFFEDLVPVYIAFGVAGYFGLSIFLLGRRRVRDAGLLLYAVFYVLTGLILFEVIYFSDAVALEMLAVIVASTLFGARGTLLGLFSLLPMNFIAFLTQGGISGDVLGPNLILLVANALSLVMAAGLLWLFAGNLQFTLRSAERVAGELRAVARINQIANQYLSTADLLPTVVETIREQLGLYHVQVFLVDDPRENAVLVASTGTAGEKLLVRQHSLPVGSRSVIGQVTQLGQYVYATDTSADPVHRRNEFLPASRSELALPLLDGETTVGALDVQSTQPNAFASEDIDVLTIMANQIAIALRNARLFEQTQASLVENQQLYEQAQRNLQDLERLNRQLTGIAWEQHLVNQGRDIGVQFDIDSIQRHVDWTPQMVNAIKDSTPVFMTDTARSVTTVAVPLEVRGNIVGAIEVDLPPSLGHADAIELIEAVTDRLTLSLDNNRLFEEAQAAAQQEKTINAIGGKLQTANEIDSVLRLTLTELSQALGADQAAIRLSIGTALAADNGHQSQDG